MSRFNDTEVAVLYRLRALKANPDVTINLLDLGANVGGSEFTHGEIMDVLVALEHEKIIAFQAGNRLRILKKLPQ